MADLGFLDRVLDTFTGTNGNITVSGSAPTGFRTLSALLTTNGDTGVAVLENKSTGQWELTRLTRVSANEYERLASPYDSSTGALVNFSAGTKRVWGDIPSFFAQHLNTIEAAVASASTCNIGAVRGLCVEITGTATITSFGTSAHKVRFVRFSGALTLTHNGTSLILPGAANIATAAGDTAIFRSDASGNWRCVVYQRASGAVHATSIEMGATDTTLSRPAAGRMQVEGEEVLTTKDLSGTLSSAQKALLRGNLAVTREVLSANRTYYVRGDGSNSNDGLTNSSGGAFLTLQKAIDVIAGLDLSTFVVTIQIGATGTYAGCTASKPFVGGPGSLVRIIGDTGSPGSYVISSQVWADNGAELYIRGVDFTSSSFGVRASNGAVMRVDGAVIFGACVSAHIYAAQGGRVFVSVNYTIDGNAGQHILAQYNAYLIVQGVTVTLTGTPAFSQFAYCDGCAVLQGGGNTYSGSATGARYLVTNNSYMRVDGGGASYFPGDSGGSATNGGQYA